MGVQATTALLKQIDEIMSLLNDFKALINCHMVEFITGDLYRTMVPLAMQDELLQMTDEQLCILPSSSADFFDPSVYPFTCELLKLVRRLSLDSSNYDHIRKMHAISGKSMLTTTTAGYNQFMGEKKCHEVEKMATFLNDLALSNDLHNIIDIGSGKGYLSSLLATAYGFKVIGLDSKCGNTSGAEIRHANVKKHWSGFMKRLRDIEALAEVKDTSCERTMKGTYEPITRNVDHETKLSDILDVTVNGNLIVCGLHTCGDLVANTIHMFLHDNRAKVLCLVGCCYHLIEEKYSKNPYRTADSPDPSAFGFPMSSYVNSKRFYLGRNARILAAQPVARILENNAMPNRSLHWRALLQKMLFDNIAKIGSSDKLLDIKIGPIAKKCTNFKDYVRLALKKINVDLEFSTCVIEHYEAEFASYATKMNAFFQFRCIFAPLIEAIILLDKLHFLTSEIAMKEAHIIKLFDPKQSPRCYALFAWKEERVVGTDDTTI